MPSLKPHIAAATKIFLETLVSTKVWDSMDVICICILSSPDAPLGVNVRHWTAKQFREAGIDFMPPATDHGTASTVCI